MPPAGASPFISIESLPMLVRFHEVSKAFGSFDVLSDVSFEIQPAQKVGLIGPNGAGKTTLLNLVSTPGEADSGTITHASGLRIGRLEQIPKFAGSNSVLEEARLSFKHLQNREEGWRQLEAAMAEAPNPELLERYSELQNEFEFGGGYSYRARTEGALLGVGFRQEQFAQSAQALSGGEKNRLALAKLLLSDVDFPASGRADQPPGHTIDRMARALSEGNRQGPSDRLTRSVLPGPHRHTNPGPGRGARRRLFG